MLSPAQMRLFADFIHRETGIVYGESNAFQLQSRLEQIAKALNLKNLQALYELAAKGIDGHLRQLLLDLATNHETSFFRDPKIFHVIEKFVFPELRAARPQAGVLRAWCAAASFGQEPYTLAMLQSELAAKDPKQPRLDLLATDISDKALARCKAGTYSQLEVQRGLPATHLVKYFEPAPDEHWRIKPELRHAVQFRRQNLLDPLAPLGIFDFVLCRNVLIYQDEAGKKEILARIHDRIAPRGFLILGASESLIGLSDAFRQRFELGTIFYQRKS